MPNSEVKAQDTKSLTSLKALSDKVTETEQKADETNAYFWHTEQSIAGAGAGAHITQVPQDEFLQDPANGGANTLIDGDGMNIRDGLTPLAQFTRESAVIGEKGKQRIEITADGVKNYNADGIPFFDVDFDGGVTQKNKVIAFEDSHSYRVNLGTENIPPVFSETVAAHIEIDLSQYDGESTDGYALINQDIPLMSVTRLNGTYITENCRYETIGFNTTVWLDFPAVVIGEASDVSVDFFFSCTAKNFVRSIKGTAAYQAEIRLFSIDYKELSNPIQGMFFTPPASIRAQKLVPTTAPAMTFGDAYGEKGAFSVRLGEGLTAEYSNQIALGKYNENKEENLLEVGGGTDDGGRINALELTKDGNLKVSGEVEDGYGNRLSNAVAAPIGALQMYAGQTAPSGWLLCQGQAISRTDYAQLFAVIGTTYGDGDGSTTFNLPDMQDRFPVGAGSNYNLNSKGGEDSVTLTDLEVAHGHGFTAPTVGGGATTSGGMSANAKHSHSFEYAQYGRQTGSSTASALQYSGSSKATSEADISHTHSIPAHSHTVTGGGVANLGGTSADRTAHENRPPYIGINFIIFAGV